MWVRDLITYYMDILQAFEETYGETLNDPCLQDRIQKVKDALFRRSYLEAFASHSNLEAYAVRWSPSRALAYAAILREKQATKALLSKSGVQALCIGGGAGAEIAALSQFRPHIKHIVTVDIGDWAPVIKPLAANLRLLDVDVINGDALQVVPKLTLPNFSLITCLFTTNELVAQSKRGFVQLLKALNNCKPGTLFVVIESAGSYSEVQIGSKKFPVHYLLHHSLTNPKPAPWDLVDSTDSEWYRLPEDLQYPLELQNMRYFLRIYRRSQAPVPPRGPLA